MISEVAMTLGYWIVSLVGWVILGILMLIALVPVIILVVGAIVLVVQWYLRNVLHVRLVPESEIEQWRAEYVKKHEDSPNYQEIPDPWIFRKESDPYFKE